MKSVPVRIVVGILVGVAAVAFVGGFVWLISWAVTHDAKDRQQTCKQIAELAKAESYVEKSYSCFLVKEGKIVEIK